MIVILIWPLDCLWQVGKPIFLRWRVLPNQGHPFPWPTIATPAQQAQASPEPELFRPEFGSVFAVPGEVAYDKSRKSTLGLGW